MNFRLVIVMVPMFCSGSFAQFGFNRQFDVPVMDAVLLEMPWAGGMDYCQFSNIDFDFDGTQDLFVFDRTCNKVLTFIQNGSSGVSDFEYAPQYESIFPDDVRDWCSLVDYNCDGLPDIFTYTVGGCRVYRNVGNATDGHEFVLASPIIKTTLWTLGYMYFNSIDVPWFGDVDGDTDIDVLSFGVLGTAVEYRRNMSMENYGICDSLEFLTKNECWGRFRESGSTNVVTLWDTLSYPCDGTIPSPEGWDPSPTGMGIDERHSGSSVVAFDADNSSTLELVMGDISYPSVVYLHNSGTAPNTNSGMDVQDPTFPSYDVPVDLTIFPAGFHVDVNNDGNRDMLFSPASVIGSENRESVWLYENSATDVAPVFDFQEIDFLQGEMIDHGSGALPVFFDANGDGLKDLLISVHGMYDTASGNQISMIAYYQNTGTLADPEFTLITEDYEDISTLSIGASLTFYPTFGDLDDDGDEDMILGEYTGYCYYLENTGGAGNPAIFNTFTMLNDASAVPIFDGSYAFPQLVDLDRDGDYDLPIGERNGKIRYYDNIGTPSSPSFSLVTNSLGNLDVAEWWTVEGYAIPQFVDVDTIWHLVIGSKNGYLHYYDNIEGNLGGTFDLVDSTLENINIGTYSCPAILNITDDNRFEMILGNQRGGVAWYESAPITDIGITEHKSSADVLIYPNPAGAELNVIFSGLSQTETSAMSIGIFDLQGRPVLMQSVKMHTNAVDISTLASGTYVLRISDEGGTFVKVEKLIIRH